MPNLSDEEWAESVRAQQQDRDDYPNHQPGTIDLDDYIRHDRLIGWIEPGLDGSAQSWFVSAKDAMLIQASLATCKGYSYLSPTEALTDFMLIHWCSFRSNDLA